MYQLSKYITEKLQSDTSLRLRVAVAMNVSEDAIRKSISRSNGKSIADNYHAVKFLMNELNLTEEQILEPETEKA